MLCLCRLIFCVLLAISQLAYGNIAQSTSSSYRDEQTSGLFSNGGLSISLGNSINRGQTTVFDTMLVAL